MVSLIYKHPTFLPQTMYFWFVFGIAGGSMCPLPGAVMNFAPERQIGPTAFPFFF